MTGINAAKNLQELAGSLASVSRNSKKLDILIFGAGLGGLAMLEVLSQSEGVTIHAIVDNADDAAGFQLARELNINTSTDSEAALNAFYGDIIIDVTGDPELYIKLLKHTEPHHIELISAKSAKLLFDLANKELRSERTIQNQNTRLNLLDSMLEITLQLEHRPPINDITNQSFEDIHNHLDAIKGLAVMFDKTTGTPQFVGAIGDAIPQCDNVTGCDFSACNAIRIACKTLTKKDRYKVFKTEIQLQCAELNTGYNVVLPLWQDSRLAGALFFELSPPLSNEKTTILEMASIHLNMTFKTLDHFQQLEEMAIFDSLTGVFNRRKFDMQLHQEVSRIKRMKHGTLSCAFIDLDDFKHVNDTYGHQVGDLVLKHIGASIESCIRDYDLCARYGGDEFVILMPSDEPVTNAYLEKAGMRILEKVSQFHLVNHPEMKVSISIGIATQPGTTANAESLLKEADDALYQAKEAGKGCLFIHGAESVSLLNK